MTDPRRVEPRCQEAGPIGDFGRKIHRCVFRDGHAGLHCSDGVEISLAPAVTEPFEGPRMRWGTPEQLHEELTQNGSPTMILRCTARSDGYQCDLKDGHPNYHRHEMGWPS